MTEAVEMVTITKTEHEHLLERNEFLNCLQAVGVDNWDGYGEAHAMMEEQEEGEE